MPASNTSRRVDHVLYQTMLRVRQRVDRATFLLIVKDLQDDIELDSGSRRSLARLVENKDDQVAPASSQHSEEGNAR